MSPTTLQSIPLDRIDASDRLRPVDESYAEAIAASMADIGLTEPVIVRTDGAAYVLVAGAHRFRAAQLLGWAEIPAIVQDIDALQARLVEIDENLMRHELGAYDRAIFLAERKLVWERMHPETVHGGDRKSLKNKAGNQVANFATRFTAEAAEKTRLSERTIRMSVQIAEALAVEVRGLIRQTYLATHQSDLDKLSRMPPERQIEAVRRLASGEVKTLAGAFGRTERDPEEVMVQKAMDLWNRAPAKVRRRMLTFFGVSPGEVDRIVNPRGVKAQGA